MPLPAGSQTGYHYFHYVNFVTMNFNTVACAWNVMAHCMNSCISIQCVPIPSSLPSQTQVVTDSVADAIRVVLAEAKPLVILDDVRFKFYSSSVSQ